MPAGLARDPSGTVIKHPDREVQGRIALVFAAFQQLRSAAQVVRHLNAQGLALPRRDRCGEVCWKPPTVAAVLAVLKNPAYAGAVRPESPMFQYTRALAAQGMKRKGVLHREKTPFTWVPLPGSAKERSDVPSAGDHGLRPGSLDPGRP